MIKEVKIFVEEKADYLSYDIKNYLNNNEMYDYDILFSTTPIQSEGSNTGILYNALIVIKDKPLKNLDLTGTSINQSLTKIENKGPNYNQGDIIC